MRNAISQVAVLASAMALNALGSAEPAVKAESFIDSIGVNVHLHYTDTAYFRMFPAVRQALLDLHIRHIRDGVVERPVPEYVQRFRLLGYLGIKTIFITRPEQTVLFLNDFPASVGQTFEAYEAPNEWDNGSDKNWADTLRGFLPTLFIVAKEHHVPLVGPSLVKTPSFEQLGDVALWESFGNLHNYPGGRNPGTSGWGDNGYGSLAFHLRNVHETSGNLPAMSTETGYDNNAAGMNYVPEDVAARYLPRLLLMQYLGGIRRTYLYELLSSGHEDYGLLRADCTPKPGFRAVAALMTLLDDHDSRPTAGSLDFHLTGLDPSARHLLLQKRNGVFYLAIWLESSSFDVPRRIELAVKTQTAHLQLPWTPKAIAIHRWNLDGAMSSEIVKTSPSFDLPISDSLTIIELVPNAALAKPTTKANEDPS